MEKYVQRPYQLECEQAIYEAGPGKHLIALATGLGKTVIFTHLTGMGRTLILSHRDELVRQPEKYYAGRTSFGIEKAQEHAEDEEIVSASIQSLSQDSRLSRYAPDAFETIIIDEAHHAAAPTYKKVLAHFSGASRILGFTATPKRGDGVRLDDVFDDIIYAKDIRWGIRNEYLSRIRCEEVSVSLDLNKVDKINGDYNAGQLEHEMLYESLDIIPEAARAYMEICHEQGKHTLIYCVTKKVSVILAETIRRLLPEPERESVAVLLGDTPDEERKAILAGFTQGKIRCIVNCMVLTEGTDLPICDAVMNLRPTCNDTLYQQMVGRGTRLYNGKEYCLVVDVVPKKKARGNRTLCTAPTLFGIDPYELDAVSKGKLTEETDLLDFCDSLSTIYANKAAKLELLRRKVDLFAQECEEVFEKAAGKTLSVLAAAYKIRLYEQARALPKDFDGLDVHVFADEQKRYLIRPNWDEEIWISEPDILNHVTVRFESLNGNCPFHKEMEFQAALDLVRMYCYIQPDFCASSWDKEIQNNWEKLPATRPQMSKLGYTLKQYDISVRRGDELNKRTASGLIDLTMRADAARNQASIFELAESTKKNKKVREAKAKVEAMLSGQEEDICANPALPEQTKASYEQKKKEAEEAKKRVANQVKGILDTGYLTVTPSMIPSRHQGISDAQAGFLSSLIEETGMFSDRGKATRSLTKRQASLMISFLLMIKDIDKEVRREISFPSAWKTCLDAEFADAGPFQFEVVRNSQ